MTKKIRIAIIGCNNMGQKHLKVLREKFSEQVEIVGILNSTPESSKRRAEELNLPYFKNIDDINPQNVDAVIISTPGNTHSEIGAIFLSKGLPCLIEKPMATTLQGCKKLIEASTKGKSIILTGHTENYNPAVECLKKELESPIVQIEGIRTSKNASNKTNISAIQELMIHDLAIVYSLLGDDLKKIKTSKRQDLSWENHAIAELEYKNGAKVKLEALRENRDVERYMNITDKSGNKFHIDFMSKSLYKNGQILTEGGNPLQKELENFLNCIRKKETPKVNAQEATNILKLCLKLEQNTGIFQQMHACEVVTR